MNKPLFVLCLLAATPALAGETNVPYTHKYLLSYAVPFAAYYVGVLARHFAKFLRAPEWPPLREQLAVSIVVATTIVVPLLPAVGLAIGADGGVDVIAFALILAVLMQEGLILHERAVALVNRLVTEGNNPTTPTRPDS